MFALRAATSVSILRAAVYASPIFLSTNEHSKKHKDYPEWGSANFYAHLGVSFLLVLAGGVFAGLTLGLMGLDELHLRVLNTSSDDPQERKNAGKVLRLLAKGRHWVLVVLLLGNVIVNESLPIFLDSAIGGGIAAVVISTVMIVIFGIIPQALCARYGLQIGARCAPIVLGMMWIFAPIAYPTAKLLDYVLGSDEGGNHYKKAELKSFLQFHRHSDEPLRDDEITILNGVLSLNDKRVEQIMTPMKDVVTLNSDTILDHRTVDQLLLSGYSRFPVHTPDNPYNFIGILLIKRLIAYDPELKLQVNAIPLSILPEARRDINCFQALDYFQTGRAHLLLISERPGAPQGALGVVTLEDIIEEIIEEEIVDETDRYESNQSKRRAKRMSTAATMKGIVEHEKGRRLSLSNSTEPNGTDSRTNTPYITPSTSNEQGLQSPGPQNMSLVGAATETSWLLRKREVIEEHPDEDQAAPEHSGSKKEPIRGTGINPIKSSTRPIVERQPPQVSSSYGAVLTSSP